MNDINGFITFRRMITPLIIQGVYWFATGLAVLGSLVMLIFADDNLWRALAAINIFLAPLFIRILAEMMLVVFKINDSLVDISDHLKRVP